MQHLTQNELNYLINLLQEDQKTILEDIKANCHAHNELKINQSTINKFN